MAYPGVQIMGPKLGTLTKPTKPTKPTMAWQSASAQRPRLGDVLIKLQGLPLQGLLKIDIWTNPHLCRLDSCLSISLSLVLSRS